MTIDCYISASCSSGERLNENIHKAVKSLSMDASVTFHVIDDEKARSLGLMGSPSVLMNGNDILPGEIPGLS